MAKVRLYETPDGEMTPRQVEIDVNIIERDTDSVLIERTDGKRFWVTYVGGVGYKPVYRPWVPATWVTS